MATAQLVAAPESAETAGDRSAGGSWVATRWLAVRWLRRRVLAVVPLAVILAAGVTGTMLALAASQRTADAYGAYQGRADIGDVVINPSWATREIDSE